MTMRNPSTSVWRAFLRHRYRAHVQGWLAVAVGLLWGYYIDQFKGEPLWAVLPAAFIGAFFVVAVLVAGAVILRFPWWALAPFCFVSMACEWALRHLLNCPWHRKPQPRERLLSNPFAIWQGWSVRRRRKLRSASPLLPALPLSDRSVSHAMRARPARVKASWEGVGEYFAEAFEVHWKFWVYFSPLWIGLWLWLMEDMTFLAAVIVAIVMSFILSVVLIIPLLAAPLALVSTLLFAASMTPRQRLEAAETLRRVKTTEHETLTRAPIPAAQKSSWIWPLLIGLWIGSAWGDDQ